MSGALPTPANRDRVIDAVRAASLLVVVAGHWLMAGVVVDDGRIEGVNALTAVPALQPLTWILQVMPLFFMAGGFANRAVWRRVRDQGGGYADFLRDRMFRLVPPVLVFAVVAQTMLGMAALAGARTDNVEFLADLLGRPLWFLAVYVLITVAAPMMAGWHAKAPVLALLLPAVGAVAADAVRIAGGVTAPAYVNFVLVWLVAQQLGFWYADGRLPAMRRGVLVTIVLAVTGVLLALTVAGPYSVSMIGLPGEMSNMSPPSVCLLLLAFGQAALLMLVRPWLAAALHRPAPWTLVVGLGARGMQLYLWHLTALVAVVGLSLLLGTTLPAAGTAWWWLTRPLWLALLAAALAGVVAAVTRLERIRAPVPRAAPEAPRAPASPVQLLPGVLLVVAGLLGYATSGLEPFGTTGSWLLGMHPSLPPSSLFLLLGWVVLHTTDTSRRPGTSRHRPS